MRSLIIVLYALLAACSDPSAKPSDDVSFPLYSVDDVTALSSGAKGMMAVYPGMSVTDIRNCVRVFELVDAEGGFASIDGMPAEMASVFDNDAYPMLMRLSDHARKNGIDGSAIYYRGSFFTSGVAAEISLPRDLAGRSELCGKAIGSSAALIGLLKMDGIQRDFEEMAEREMTREEKVGFAAIGMIASELEGSEPETVKSCLGHIVESYRHLPASDDALAVALPVYGQLRSGADVPFDVDGLNLFEVKGAFLSEPMSDEAQECVATVAGIFDDIFNVGDVEK